MRSLDDLLARFSELGVERVLCKRLAENDNRKQQVYLGGSFDALNLLPFGKLLASKASKVPTMKAPMRLSWLDGAGVSARAPGAQLILYPGYPEVRLSGFLRECETAPAEQMRPIPKSERRFNNGPDGRLLFLGIAGTAVFAFLAIANSDVAGDFDKLMRRSERVTAGVFINVPMPKVGDSRILLIARLREICAAGWHPSRRLRASGEVIPYVARNGAGYTLEALFGIRPNARSAPDFHGWELKAVGSDRVTLMTPEPDLGFYGVKGVEAFVRRYGYDAGDDTMYFTGAHRANQRHEKSHMLLTVKGFDPAKSKITDVDGGIFLVDTKEEVAAGWSFRALIAHWARKHAAAAYVPYEVRETDSIQYRYVSPASLGEGTQFSKFLAAMITGNVIYDPAPKVMNASSGNPTVKARSQFRTRFRTVNLLYERFADEAIG